MSIPELTLTGLPRERGNAHGETFRELIADTLDRWFAALAPRTDPRTFVNDVFHTSGLRVPVETHTPELLEEVAGIAEGAAQDVAALFAWQLIDECWWYLDRLTGDLHPRERCSAMAVNDGRRGFVAQTQDLYRHFDGNQVQLRYIHADGLEILAPSAAGLLAYNGVNSAGVAVCITTLSELPHQTNGVSSGFVVPSLLRCRTIDDAIGWLEATPAASGNSWTLGSRDRSVVVEASAAGIDIVDDGSRALHTNHALVQTPVWEFPRFATSAARYAQLDTTVEPAMTLDEVSAMYAAEPICRSRQSTEAELSVGTMIFELDADQRCHFAAGPLDEEPLVTFTMTSSGSPPA